MGRVTQNTVITETSSSGTFKKFDNAVGGSGHGLAVGGVMSSGNRCHAVRQCGWRCHRRNGQNDLGWRTWRKSLTTKPSFRPYVVRGAIVAIAQPDDRGGRGRSTEIQC